MSSFFFHAKRSSYYFRGVIPLTLRLYFDGSKELWRSLKTQDKDTARVRSLQVEAQVQRVFVTLKRHGETMTNDEVNTLIANWMKLQLDEAEDFRATAGPLSDRYRDDVQLILSDQLQEATEALVSCDYRPIAKEAEELVKSSGLPALNHGSADFGRLCRRLLLAKQRVVTTELERWQGVYTNGPVNRTSFSDSISNNGWSASPKPTTVTEKPFSEVVKLYFKENTRAKRTDAQIHAELKRFMTALGGDRPITLIDKGSVRAYKEYMLQTRKLSLATCIKHLSSLSGVFRWAEAQGFIPDGSNPVNGLAPNKRQAKRQASLRRPFTDAELLKVFGSQEFTKQRQTHPERYWLVLLCLFQVCRREEAGQLNLSDISEQDGIPFLRITDAGEGQQVKNEGSKRRLPLHSSLITLGFLEYVQMIKAAGHVRLFPQLKKGMNGYSDAVGKFFSRLVTKAGLTDPALVLHSLRHGGITKLHAAGVPHNIVVVLAGHAADNVHGQVYVHREGLPLSLLREGLEKLRYEEVVKQLG